MGGCKSKPVPAGKGNDKPWSSQSQTKEPEKRQKQPESTPLTESINIGAQLLDQLGTDVDMLPSKNNNANSIPAAVARSKSSSSAVSNNSAANAAFVSSNNKSSAASSSSKGEQQRQQRRQRKSSHHSSTSSPVMKQQRRPSRMPNRQIESSAASSYHSRTASSDYSHGNNNIATTQEENADHNSDNIKEDPQWADLFTTLYPNLLDPEDLTSTLDTTISNMIDHLSPVEVSFIRRRVKLAIKAIVYNAHENDSVVGGNIACAGIGGGGTSFSLSKKMGRLLGKEGDSSKSSSASMHNHHHDASSSSTTTATSSLSSPLTSPSSLPFYHCHPALLHETSSTSITERIKVSKSVYQKERLIDITIMRKIFEGGERCLRDMQWQFIKNNSVNQNSDNGGGGISSRRNSGGGGSKSLFPLQQQQSQVEDAIPNTEESDRQQQQYYEALDKIDIYGSAYLLIIHMSESRWDYITEIARLSAKSAGLILDVNKLQHGHEQKQRQSHEIPIPSSAPLPSSKSPCELYNNPDLTLNEPGGVHFTSLCYLIALALRGTRRQRLSLLFHILLSPKELDTLLSSHPAGGLPTWLLEVDGDVVFSYDSLSYYYNYEDVMLPSVRHGLKKRSNNIKRSSLKKKKKKKLCVDAVSVVEILATILTKSSVISGDKGSYGIRRLSDVMDSHLKDTSKDREVVVETSSVQCHKVSDMLLKEIREGADGKPNFRPSKNETRSLKAFLEACNRITANASGPILWSMKKFVSWADVAIDETILDKVMRHLFGTGILPGAKVEHKLVTQRWINWNIHQEIDHVHTSRGKDERTVPPKSMFQKIFVNDDSDNSQDLVNLNDWDKVWGGIGGTDGKGGLGHGVLYCIDKSWWDDWVAYTGWETDESNGYNPTSLKRPRELSTERLIDRSIEAISMSGTRGSYEVMKQSLLPGKHFVLIPPGVWNVLYEMYGGGPPLPRMVLPPENEDDVGRNCLNEKVISTEDESVEVSSAIRDHSDFLHPKAITKSIRVATHPWIIHCQICDPQQPYRRGDLGPMSVRVMVMPYQPLWRFFAEIVARLPIIHSKTPDFNCEGRARLWKIESVNGKNTSAGSRFGPWTLLCKNSHAEIPISTSNYVKYEEQWKSYCDQHSIESIGLLDGMRVLFEYVVASKDGSFSWPREAAAKATQLRRIADEDAKFRFLLRGYGPEGEPSREPIMRKNVDVMDASGRWYRGLIVNVEKTDKSTMEHNDSSGPAGIETSKDSSFQEYTHVCIHFYDHHENHEEWIEVKSDRLAVAGRFTSNANLESDTDSDVATETTRSILSGSKKKDSNDLTSNDQINNAVCLFPSYGACGLINLGNTCYANSAWQCLSYMPLLRFYLLSGQYKISGDINRDNPLGTGGKILEEFADLMRVMWSGKFGARAPQRFRSVLAKCRPRYSGANQQDVPELLTDILDTLHEDANRVKRKPFVEALEDEFIEKSGLQRIGQESWRRYLRRNRSIITDLCMGQLFNLVTCPECNHSSKNFDPFNVLSLPLPTVDEVIFRCTVIRRATTINCPNTLPLVAGSSNGKLNSIEYLSPPSKELIFEEYAIPTSRLADLGDLKMKLQQLSGIPSKRLRLCKKEDIGTGIGEKHSITRVYTKVISLPDREGPCLKLLNHTLDDAASPTIATVVVFETTLQPRPESAVPVDASDNVSTDDDTSTDTSSTQATGGGVDQVAEWKSIEKIGEEYLKIYGDEEECISFDTDPLPLAKYVSRSLWPKVTEDFTLGLRVDAIDRRNNWYPGSVVEIVEDENEEGCRNIAKVRVHFDNFSSKWDEVYSIINSRIRPLYSHSTPRPKPTEFIVHHRGVDQKSKKVFLFGQSFFVQCHNEWSNARAGAHVLAQASRFLELSHFKMPENGKKISSVESKIAEKERDDARKAIAGVIKALILSDKKYINAAVESGRQRRQNNKSHSPFDVTTMAADLTKKLSDVLHFLPFDVLVTTADSPLGIDSEEVKFPFSLIRTIGNYMNARHSLVLHWRERSDTIYSNSTRKNHSGYRQLLYVPPFFSPSKHNHKLLGASGNEDLKRHPSSSHGGFHIGSCLAEFFKEQHLDATGCWRCPVCKEDREGKQSMALWNLPDFLVFHLKRFNASSRWSEKITTRVDFPVTGLNMREWCDKNSPLSLQSSEEPFMYDLIGVVNHMGDIDTGHYVAACKATVCSPDGNEEVAYNFNGTNTTTLDSFEEESTSSGWRIGRSKEKDSSTKAASKAVSESAEPLWLKFDDEFVEPVPPQNVVTEAAYVLFYRRRRMHPSNVAKYSSLD